MLDVKDVNYRDLIDNIDKISDKSSDEIIHLDVLRSFQIHEHKMPQKKLFTLLKTYAHLRPDINYCQGMNYLIGFLYLQCQDDILCLNIFSNLVKKYFENVFTSNMQQLKILFYQFDKLLELFLPEMANIFKIEKIDCQYFIAPWLITLFTQVYQNTSSSYLLLNIWDVFISEGWKGFFKITLYLLKINFQRFQQMNFDQILNYLNEFMKNEIFLISDNIQNFQQQDYQYIKELKKNIQQFKITKSMLKQFENEYINTVKRVDLLIKELKSKV